VDALYIPEAFGCHVRMLETGPLVDPLPLNITSLEDVDQIPRPDPARQGRLPIILETARHLSAYSGGHIPVVGLFEGPFTTACRVIEAELIMRMIYKNAAVLEHLLDSVNDFLTAFGQALIKSGANMLVIPEPTASASMISPNMFRQLVLPRLQKLIRKLGVPCILHICGDTSVLLEIMAQTGAHVLSLDQCMNLSECREKLPKAVLAGNVDPINALLMGSIEQVQEETLRCLRAEAGNPFLLMSGCGVPPKSPVENVRAMVSTAIEYGLGEVT
jgi:MtaA/CmuA family methyltransferase